MAIQILLTILEIISARGSLEEQYNSVCMDEVLNLGSEAVF